MEKIKAYYDNDRFLPLLVKELSDYAIFLMTTEGFIASWNEGAELIKGYKEQEVLGKHFRMLFPERFQKKKDPEKELKEAIKKGRFEGREWRRKKNGDEFFARVILIPLYDDAKKHVGFAKITQDLTQEKEVEEKLKEKSEQIRHAKEFGEAVLDTINEGIVVLNAKAQIESSNEVFNKLFRIKAKVAAGKTLPDIHPRWKENDLKKLINNLIEDERYFKKKEIEFFFDDEKRVFSVTARFIHHNHNRDLKILLAFDDITIEKQIETARSDFASFVSHELRTPITNIKAYVQLIEKCRKENRDCDYEKYLSKTLLFTDNLTSLINELHESNKAGSEKIQIEKRQVILGHVIDDALETLRTTFPGQEFIKEGKANVKVNVDPVRITQVLTNFITNAIKYSEGKKVTIQLKVDLKNVTIKVKDEGKGINKEELKNMFTRYYRSKSALKKEGMGMGLYLAKKIIKAHSGEIGVESKVGIGSVFYFSLPLKAD